MAEPRRMTPTAVLVTRGDVDLDPILKSLPTPWPTVVWDNSRRPEDLKVYGRYAALQEAETDYVYVQDDDAICPAQAIADSWTPSRADRILTNVRDGDTPWLSCGAIFHRDLPAAAISRYTDAYGMDDDVLWWCDVIVMALTRWENIDLGAQHLPYHNASNRMFVQTSHYAEQRRVREKAEALL